MEVQTSAESLTTDKNCSASMFITRRELYDIIRKAYGFKTSEKLNFLKNEVVKRFKPSDMPQFNKLFFNFCTQYKKRWENSHRDDKRFMGKNDNWLKTSITFQPQPKKHVPETPPLTEESNNKTTEQKCPNCGDVSQISLRSSKCVGKTLQLTTEEALTVLLDAELSPFQYNIIRKYAPEKFPPLTSVLKAKQNANA